MYALQTAIGSFRDNLVQKAIEYRGKYRGKTYQPGREPLEETSTRQDLVAPRPPRPLPRTLPKQTLL